jgi:hypothetical protein
MAVVWAGFCVMHMRWRWQPQRAALGVGGGTWDRLAHACWCVWLGKVAPACIEWPHALLYHSRYLVMLPKMEVGVRQPLQQLQVGAPAAAARAAPCGEERDRANPVPPL